MLSFNHSYSFQAVEILAGGLRIVLDLRREAFNIVKLALGAQELVKVNAHLMAVEVSAEIKQKALDVHIAAVAHGRADTDIRHRQVLLPVDICLGRVNSAARDDNALRKAHVDGGRAHLRSEAVAAADMVGERVRMAEVGVRLFHIAAFDELADERGADDNSVAAHGGDDVAADAALCAVASELFGCAESLVTKAEIVPDDDPAQVHLVDELVDEVLPVHAHDAAAEVDDDDLVDAEAAL